MARVAASSSAVSQADAQDHIFLELLLGAESRPSQRSQQCVRQLTVELRLLGVNRGTNHPIILSGYFDNHGDIVKVAKFNSHSARGTYITLNPVQPALLARSLNRLQVAGKNFPLTSDSDIVQRRWLPIDLDPVRASGISSTDEEHDAAISLAFEIRDALTSEEWPEPLIVDSGNGAHLLYRIDLASTDNDLVKRCLCAPARRFDNDHVKIDQGGVQS